MEIFLVQSKVLPKIYLRLMIYFIKRLSFNHFVKDFQIKIT